MNNAGFFIACMALAFLVFITMRGELARYLEVIFGLDSTKIYPSIKGIM